ncbi:hypothetical protein DFH09DRAFT_1097000 [Mycena vulgaris]|nr:hypothetical protein DFH09DRAFT_1097000 [Mycena vulgaris]
MPKIYLPVFALVNLALDFTAALHCTISTPRNAARQGRCTLLCREQPGARSIGEGSLSARSVRAAGARSVRAAGARSLRAAERNKAGARSFVEGSRVHAPLARAASAHARRGQRELLGLSARSGGQLAACPAISSTTSQAPAPNPARLLKASAGDVHAKSGASPTRRKRYPRARTAAGSQVKRGRRTAAATRGDGGGERKSCNLEIPTSTWEYVVPHGPRHGYGQAAAPGIHSRRAGQPMMRSAAIVDPISPFSPPPKPPSPSHPGKDTVKQVKSRAQAPRAGKSAALRTIPGVDRRSRLLVESTFPKSGTTLLQAGKGPKFRQPLSLAELVAQGRDTSAALNDGLLPPKTRLVMYEADLGRVQHLGWWRRVSDKNVLAQSLGPFRRSEQPPGLSDILVPAALELDEDLARRALNIVNDEHRRAFPGRVMPAADPVYVNEQGCGDGDPPTLRKLWMNATEDYSQVPQIIAILLPSLTSFMALGCSGGSQVGERESQFERMVATAPTRIPMSYANLWKRSRRAPSNQSPPRNPTERADVNSAQYTTRRRLETNRAALQAIACTLVETEKEDLHWYMESFSKHALSL